MQIIVFDLYNKQYAIKTEQVEEISKILEITPVPNAPYFIQGLVNLRGNVISVIDLAKLLGIQPKEDVQYRNIIIVNVNKEMIGLLVGEVREVMEIEENKIEKVELGHEEQKGVEGIIQKQDGLINFLNLDDCFTQ